MLRTVQSLRVEGCWECTETFRWHLNVPWLLSVDIPFTFIITPGMVTSVFDKPWECDLEFLDLDSCDLDLNCLDQESITSTRVEEISDGNACSTCKASTILFTIKYHTFTCRFFGIWEGYPQHSRDKNVKVKTGRKAA